MQTSTEAAFLIRTGTKQDPFYLTESKYDSEGIMRNSWTPFIMDAKHDFKTYAEAEGLKKKIEKDGTTATKMHGVTVITRPICPKCGQVYNGRPAISRDDNKTKICSDCGNREAFRAFMEAANGRH